MPPAPSGSSSCSGQLQQPEKAKAKRYKNCTQLRKTYKGGVAKPGVKGNKVGSKIKPFKIKPKFSTTLYKKNRHLDRDKDGIACEA